MKLQRKGICLGLVLTLGSMMTAAAGLDDSVARCQAIEDRAARLNCFDALPESGTQAAAPAVSEATPPTKNQQKTAAVSRSNSRDDQEQLGDFPKTLAIAKISKTIDDRHIFYLSDGSAWQEVRNGSKRFDTNRAVTIERSGSLGSSMFASYWMTIDDAKFKVLPLR